MATKVELEVWVNGDRAMKQFQAKYTALFKQLEKQNKIDLKINNTAQILGDLRKVTAELQKIHKLASQSSFRSTRGNSPSAPGTSRSSNSGFPSSSLAQHTKELRQIEQLEKQIARSRVQNASTAKEKESAKIYQEMVRHAQTLARIKVTVLGPNARLEAERLAKALHGINLAKIRSEFQKTDQIAKKSMQGMSDVVAIALGNIAGTVATFGLGVISSGIGAILGSSTIDAARNSQSFNQTLKVLQVNSKATDSQMQELKSIVEQVSEEFGILPQKVADTAIELVRSGTEIEKVGDVLKAAFQTAIATSSDIEPVTDVIRSVAKLYKEVPLEDIAGYATQAINDSAGGAEELRTQLSYVLADAKSLGLEIPQIFGSLTALSNAGMGNRAGGLLSGIFMDMNKAKDGLKEIGIEVYNATTGANQMDTALLKLVQTLEKLPNDEARTDFLLKFKFDAESIRGINAYVAQGSAELEKYTASIKGAKDAAKDQAAEIQKTNEQTFKRIQSKASLIQKDLGDMYNPAIAAALAFGEAVLRSLGENKDMFDNLGQASQEFANYLKENPELVDKTSTAIARLVTIISGEVLEYMQSWLNYLEENEDAIDRGIESTIKTVQVLGDVFQALMKVAELYANIVNFVFRTFEGLSKWLAPIIQATDAMKLFNAQQERANQLKGGLSRGVGSALGKTSGGGGNNEVQISESEMYQLAALAVAEAPSREGRTDVAQAVFNRLNSGQHGSSVTDVAFQSGQFEPYFGVSPNQTATRAGAIAFLQSRGYSEQQAAAALDQTIADVGNPGMMSNSAMHVGGRTDFKGTSMYGNMTAEDRLRDQGENFYHIGSGQTYDQLAGYQRQAPSSIVVGIPGASTRDSSSSAGSSAQSSADRYTSQAAQDAAEEERKRQQREARDRRVAPVGVRTMANQEYGASRDGGARAHAGEDLDVAAGQNSVSYLGGQVLEIQDWTEQGNGFAALIYNASLGVTELIGEFQTALVAVGDVIEAGTEVGSGANEVRGVSHVEIHRGRGRTRDTVDPLDFYEKVGADPGTGRVFDGDQTQSYRIASDLADDAEKERKRKEDETKREREILRDQQRNNEDEVRQMQRREAARQREQAAEARRLAVQSAQQQFEGTDISPLFDRQLEQMGIDDEFLNDISEAKERLQDLEIQRDRLKADRANEPGMKELLAQYETAISQEKDYVRQLEERVQTRQNMLQQKYATEDNELERNVLEERASNNATRALKQEQLAQQEYLATIDNDAVRSYEEARLSARTSELELTETTRTLTEEIERQQKALDAYQTAGGDMGARRVQLLQERIASLREELVGLQDISQTELRIKLEIARDELDRVVGELQSGIRQRIEAQQVSRARRQGDELGARRLEMANQQRGMNEQYSRDRAEIEGYRSTLGDSKTDSLLSDRMQQHQLESRELKDSLDPVAQLLPELAGGFNTMFSTIFSNFDNLGQVALQILDQLLSKLLEMAAMELFSNLFGSVGGGLLGGSDASGLMSGGGMAVPTAARGTIGSWGQRNLTSMPGAIGQAARLERSMSGREPVLAMLNRDEGILNAEQMQSYQKSMEIPSFAGGSIPAIGGKVTPLTFNGGSFVFQGSNVDQVAFAEFAKQTNQEIHKKVKESWQAANRPGGILRKVGK